MVNMLSCTTKPSAIIKASEAQLVKVLPNMKTLRIEL